MDLDKLLSQIKQDGASDLHLNAGSRPSTRVDGALKILKEYDVLTPEFLQNIVEEITSEHQRELLEKRRELDLAYYTAHLGRFRVNILHQRGSLSLNFRVIATDVAPLSAIGLPEIYAKASLSRKGSYFGHRAYWQW